MKTPEEKNGMATFEKKLAPFLSRNLNTKIEKRGKLHYVTNAWNVKTISFVLKPDSQSDLIAALNSLVLPPRFTALYHLDTNTMEYIFTLVDRNSSYLSRQFEFMIEGKSYYCRFEDASERLLLLSKLFRPAGEEIGDDRNLMLLHMYANPHLAKISGLEKDFFAEKKPVSFFVGEFEAFDEEKIVEISKHLNFFMQYYDRKTTYTIIHPPKSGEPEPVKQLQFVEADFPKKISTQRQNPLLLDLALAANEADTRLKFIYYYQILEYAAFYYIDDNVKRDLLRIINTPDIFSNPDEYIPKILDTVSESSQDVEAKIEKIIKTNCTPEFVWRELQQNIPYFSKRQEFEGGFMLEPIISEDTTIKSFSEGWYSRTAATLRNALRSIRNALVHGREKRFGPVIAPTRGNDRKIDPWLPVIRRIAEQVIIFGRVT
ncbi:MAG: hypothetical protein HY530_03235 [Chloroflexi bacterium]|nr:hypothetical protein [Chloroflexota bacterium]